MKNAQNTVTITKTNQEGKPTRVDSHVLRLRQTKPRKTPAVTVKKLERALPLTQVASVLAKGGEVDFSVEDVHSALADGQAGLMRVYDLVYAKYAVVQAIKAPTCKSVLRLGKARSRGKKAA